MAVLARSCIARQILRAALASLLLSASPPQAFAQAAHSTLDLVQERGRLLICTSGDYKPFTVAKGDSYEGIDIEMAKSLAKAMGVEAAFVRTTWPTMMADFKAGACDVVMGGIGVTLARQKLAFYSSPVLVTGKTPLARCADKDRLATLAGIDKPEVRVIVNPGGTNESFTRSIIKQAKISVFSDNVGIFDEILAGRADVMITEVTEARMQEKARPGLCALGTDKPLTYVEVAYLLPRGDVVFKAFVDQWLHLARVTGEYARYYDQFVR